MNRLPDQNLDDAKAEMRLRVLRLLYENGHVPQIMDTQIARIGAPHHTKAESENALTELMGRFVVGMRGERERVFGLTEWARDRLETALTVKEINPTHSVDFLVLIRRALMNVDAGQFVLGECADLWRIIAKAE